MKKSKGLLWIVLIASFVLAVPSPGVRESSGFASTQPGQIIPEVYVGSTPADGVIRTILNINGPDAIDFIRWELVMKSSGNESNRFSLRLNYGVGKPSTPDFISGGKEKKAEGMFSIRPSRSGDTFIFTSQEFKSPLELIRLSDNILHILADRNNLMIGNGGWSYSLSKSNTTKKEKSVLPASLSALNLNVENNTLTFVGRTPCEPVNSEYHLELSESCIKVKWLMKLYVDPVTKNPTSFYWNRRGHRTELIEGTWTIIKGIPTHADAIICRLNPAKPFEPIDMLVADGNVLYFLDKNQGIMMGDKDFSFALNRVVE